MVDVERKRRWLAPVLEIGVSCGAALAYFATCYLIRFKALDRVGQVAGLAALSYRFLLFSIALLVALIAIARFRPAWWSMAVRLTCAAFAGLATAIVAGGVLCMLRGTPYGLGGEKGDAGVLANWAELLQRNGSTPDIYPPLQIHLIAWISDIQGVPAVYAIKTYQLLGILAFGPAVYASWRLLLRPTWALGLGIVAALPLVEPYRGYPQLVLAIFLPLAIKFLDLLRHAAEQPIRALAIRGALFGLGLGLLFLLYSGWFLWSAPGFLIAMLWVFPWRHARRQGAALCISAMVGFAAVTAQYLARVLAAPPIQDNYHYFDSETEPAYIAMWRGGLPGVVAQMWPPAGELAGVGLFTVILCVGWAASIALGARRTAVMATSWIMVGAWFLRFYHAHRMWQTQLVQLYPRTTAELVYCLLIVSGFAIYLYVEGKRERAAETSPLRTSWGVIGALCGLGLLFLSAGSAVTDRYMPREATNDLGHLAYVSHTTPHPTGNTAKGCETETASEAPEHPASAAIDQQTTTYYESALSTTPDHEAWITLVCDPRRRLSRIVLVPAGDGFPVDFTIDVWNGSAWEPRVTRRGYRATPGPQTFTWGRSDRTDQIRLHVTKLGPIGDQFGLRLAELEIFR